MSSTDTPQDSRGNGESAITRERIASAGREAARAAKRQAKQQAESLANDASSAAAAAASDASGAIDSAARAFDDAGHETLSQAAAGLSERLQQLSGYLADRKLDDLMRDAQELARRNPTLFIAGGVALGFALSRFLKGSVGDGASASVADADRNEASRH